ncbi:MAG: hypothetical protein CBD18_03540 [Opitutales bacterium TMED158]|nr:MAG: hypothetical protein CBD18_03540 [Opitutales bacterium TMED158]
MAVSIPPGITSLLVKSNYRTWKENQSLSFRARCLGEIEWVEVAPFDEAGFLLMLTLVLWHSRSRPRFFQEGLGAS